MSLLNLNTPDGRGPRSKKSSKMFMGAGLLVAVLGIGSTLAANITLNSPGGQTEFGQGITQTVYCGGDESVTVSPVSSFTNANLNYTVRVINSTTGSSISAGSARKDTIYSKDSSSFPRFTSRTSTISGWWLNTATSTGVASSYPTFAAAAGSSSSYVFAPELSGEPGKFKRGEYSTSVTPYVLTASDNSANFRLSGVNITNISPECKGINFVVSAYSDAGTDRLTFATGVDLVATNWCARSGDVPSGRLSKNRSSYSSISSGVSATETSIGLQLTFTGSDTQSSRNVSKILVETQEDVLGTACPS